MIWPARLGGNDPQCRLVSKKSVRRCSPGFAKLASLHFDTVVGLCRADRFDARQRGCGVRPAGRPVQWTGVKCCLPATLVRCVEYSQFWRHEVDD